MEEESKEMEESKAASSSSAKLVGKRNLSRANTLRGWLKIAERLESSIGRGNLQRCITERRKQSMPPADLTAQLFDADVSVKMKAHHGGAGTTAAGLKAACPTTVVPFFGDQPFWGERVHARGLGPTPIPVSQFMLLKLVDAIKFMLDPEVKERAVEVAEAMKSEDGVAGAVAAFRKHLAPRLPRNMAFWRNGANAEGRRRLYSCKYCDKAFTSSQALGGHQNGHRKEREAVNRLHQDPNSFFAFCNNPPPLPPPPPPLQPNNISSHSLPSLNLSLALSPQTQNFYRPSSTFSPDLTYYQNNYRHQPYQFNNINRETSRVDVGSSPRNFLSGSRLENGGGSTLRTENYWRLPNRAGPDDDKENEIDLTLHL